MRIGGDKIFRLAMQVGEIAAAAAGNEDFLADPLRALEHCDAASALAGFDGAHQPGSTGAEDEDIEFLRWFCQKRAALLKERRVKVQGNVPRLRACALRSG